MKKFLWLLLLLPSVSHADRLGSMNSSAQVLLTTQTATLLVATQTWSGQQLWSSPSPSTFTYGVTVGSITLQNQGTQRVLFMGATGSNISSNGVFFFNGATNTCTNFSAGNLLTGSTITALNGIVVAGTSFLGGSVSLSARTSAIDATAILGNNYIGISDTSLARTVTLFSTSTCVNNNYMLTVKDESGAAGTNNITIATVNGEKVDGAITKVINANYQSFTLLCRQAGWWSW